MAKSPAALLIDSVGNILRTIQIGSYHWLAAAVKVGDGDNWVHVAQDGANYRLMVDSKQVVVQSQQVIALLEKAGGGYDMRVDGSGTAVPFVFSADGGKDIHLQHLAICMSSTEIDLDGDSFASGNALTTGIQVQAKVNDGTDLTLSNFTVNEDFRRLLLADIAQGSVNDNMTGIISFGGDMILKAGSSDKIEVLVQDDLTAALLGLKYLTATLYAIKEV
jgi:hypothetical protein